MMHQHQTNLTPEQDLPPDDTDFASNDISSDYDVETLSAFPAE
jgi:hypothetical protein